MTFLKLLLKANYIWRYCDWSAFCFVFVFKLKSSDDKIVLPKPLLSLKRLPYIQAHFLRSSEEAFLQVPPKMLGGMGARLLNSSTTVMERRTFGIKIYTLPHGISVRA